MSDILLFEPACSVNTLYDCYTVLIYLCAHPLYKEFRKSPCTRLQCIVIAHTRLMN